MNEEMAYTENQVDPARCWMLRNSGWFTLHLLVQRGPHPTSVAGIHRHSASSTPHLDPLHGYWESDANQEFHQLVPIWSLSPIYRFCAGIYTVIGTPWFMLYPSVPLVPGQDTDTASHTVAISDRQQAKLLQKTHAPRAPLERGRCSWEVLQQLWGMLLRSQPFPDFFPQSFPISPAVTRDFLAKEDNLALPQRGSCGSSPQYTQHHRCGWAEKGKK